MTSASIINNNADRAGIDWAIVVVTVAVLFPGFDSVVVALTESRVYKYGVTQLQTGDWVLVLDPPKA